MASGKSPGFWSSLTRLYAVMEPGSRRRLWLLVVLTAASALFEVVTIGAVVPFLALLANASAEPLQWVRPLFDAVGAQTRQEQLTAATMLFCAAAVASGALRILLARKTQDFVFSFGHRLSVEVQRRMLLQPYSWHVLHNTSQQLATIEKVELVTTSVLLPLMQSVAAAILIVVVLLVLLQIAPLATLAAAVALGVAYFVLGRFARGRLHSYSGDMDDAFGQRIRVLQEGLGGIREVILDGSQSGVLDRFRSADWQLARARANAVFVSTIPRFLIEPVGIIILAGLALFLSGREGGLVAALPVLGALALGAQRLLPLVQQLYNGWSVVAANRFVTEDVIRRLDLAIPPPSPPGPRLPFERAVEFRDVSFTYPGRSEPAVDKLAFEIRRGSRVALVGRTGSGKSTTADLLMGLLEPTGGEIAVDGKVLSERNRHKWRRNIAHVPQMLFLADATIAENIALSSEPDMGRVGEAASLAQLDGFVASLPDRYETKVGERGVRVSGGQRQRLAIARAIYKDAPLLVLDEATSALDDETEAAIAAALDRLQERGTTIVIIAHRSTIIERCDLLLKMENGRLVEELVRS